MFQKTQYYLLLSYLVVFASILGTFAIAVRVSFERSLSRQMNEKLMALAEGAAVNAEINFGHLKIKNKVESKDLIVRHQALQWFDAKRRLIAQQGETVLTSPILTHQTVQMETAGKVRIQGVTVPLISSDEKKLVGYVRASQSLEELDATQEKLDWGLGGGIIVALVLSGVGGIWLTRQAMKPIEESFQRLKQFTADASHELRSPLMAIKSNAAVALKYPEGMRQGDREKFSAIASATNQMSRLTEDLLFLARTDTVPNRNWERVKLTEILENLVQLHKAQAEAKQIDLKISFSENLYLQGDAVQLVRLFSNLIENALHYTESGGVVEIKAKRVGSQLSVKIEDTGVGIAPEHLERVFERFWRAEKSRSYWNGGSGLGLAIACAIAQNHGGTITVTSELGIGSCFKVRLPAK
ncbi:ATP-binding protein [Microseira sp. BLCC-F43]|uniref:sensor histidine kinase n=1 Tax=Microseira sp. BLCC-F43 TaxID=3153602 RepID=UPI0035BB0AAF